jgi:hypothetical protein
MAYSRAKLKSNGSKAAPSFKLFLIGKMSDKCPPPLPLKRQQNSFLVQSDTTIYFYGVFWPIGHHQAIFTKLRIRYI